MVRQKAPLSLRSRFPWLTSLGRITTTHGEPTKYEEGHMGVDVANEKGTPIPAMGEGVVTGVRSGVGTGEDKGFGNMVQIKTPNQETHQFGHLNDVLVKLGQKVKPGQKIGTMGNSGAAYSPSGQGDGTHLDFRVKNSQNQYIDPLQN